ncbi:MAG: LamG domain-containing protein, partial [Phycisphaerales bacterium]
MCMKLTSFVFFVLMSALVLASVADGADPNLVGWWKLDEGSGATAVDSSGTGFDIPLQNNTWEDGVLGGAVHFPGEGQGQRGGFVYSDNAITVCAWVWHEAFRSGQVERYVTAEPEIAVIRKEADGRLHFYINTGGSLRHLWVGNVLTEGQWYHVAGTWDGLTQRLYLDGVEIASQTPGGVLGTTSGVRLSNAPEPLNGLLDDVRIYNRALTDVEILGVMSGGGAEYPLASGPNPADGSMLEATWVSMSWRAGDYAVSHDVYFSDNFGDVNSGAEAAFRGSRTDEILIVGFFGFPYPEGLVPGTTYYWRVDEVNDAEPNSPWIGDVWSFTVPPRTAYNPFPAEGSKFIETDAPTLSWTAGFNAKLHTVYFGATFDEVDNAAGGAAQSVTTFTVPGPLEPETTYYWRVDELDPPNTHKGPVWSFTTAREGGGIKGEYFNNENLSGAPVLTRIDDLINFYWNPGPD